MSGALDTSVEIGSKYYVGCRISKHTCMARSKDWRHFVSVSVIRLTAAQTLT
jgi:hypothetical protein